jgi:GxxExxY protein
MTEKKLNEISYNVIGAAIEVHKALGPGLLESIYHECLKHELSLRDISFVSEMDVQVVYKDLPLTTYLRCDLFVENCLVVELKSVNEIHPIFNAQLLTYMKLLKAPKGILINFNCLNIFEDGQKTFINEYFNLLD